MGIVIDSERGERADSEDVGVSLAVGRLRGYGAIEISVFILCWVVHGRTSYYHGSTAQIHFKISASREAAAARTSSSKLSIIRRSQLSVSVQELTGPRLVDSLLLLCCCRG